MANITAADCPSLHDTVQYAMAWHENTYRFYERVLQYSGDDAELIPLLVVVTMASAYTVHYVRLVVAAGHVMLVAVAMVTN